MRSSSLSSLRLPFLTCLCHELSTSPCHPVHANCCPSSDFEQHIRPDHGTEHAFFGGIPTPLFLLAGSYMISRRNTQPHCSNRNLCERVDREGFESLVKVFSVARVEAMSTPLHSFISKDSTTEWSRTCPGLASLSYGMHVHGELLMVSPTKSSTHQRGWHQKDL